MVTTKRTTNTFYRYGRKLLTRLPRTIWRTLNSTYRFLPASVRRAVSPTLFSIFLAATSVPVTTTILTEIINWVTNQVNTFTGMPLF